MEVYDKMILFLTSFFRKHVLMRVWTQSLVSSLFQYVTMIILLAQLDHNCLTKCTIVSRFAQRRLLTDKCKCNHFVNLSKSVVHKPTGTPGATSISYIQSVIHTSDITS